MGVAKYFWPLPKWSKVDAAQKFVTIVCGPATSRNLLNYYLTLAYWVLAGLHFMSFNVMTSDNDCDLVPSVGVLESSKMLFS